MLKKFSNQISPFAMYFQEAPGDEGDSVSVSVAPRQNRGTDYNDDSTNVTVAPRGNRGTDYGQEDEPDTPDAGTPDTTGGDVGGDDTPDGPDVGDDDEGTDYSADGDAEDDAEGDDAGGDDGADGDAEDGPDTGGEDGETDYTSDEGGDGGDVGDEGGDGSGEETSDEDKAEAYKKLHMYKRYMHLYNLLEVIIEKCRNIVKPDATQNAVIKTVANNLSDLYDNLFDYMTIKYKSASYVQILLYFETAISVIQLNFELLKNNKINLKQ